MARIISIDQQDFAALRENNWFYIDKTDFIKMVGTRSLCNLNHPPRRVWKDVEHKHGGALLFRRVCR